MAAALIVPLVAVAGLCLTQVNQARDKVETVDRETKLAATALAPGGLVDALIVEQGDSTVTVLNLRESATFPTDSFAESMAATDEGLAALRRGVAEGGPLAAKAYNATLDSLEEDLGELRTKTVEAAKEAGLANWVLSNEIYAGYTPAVDALAAANAALSREISDPQLRGAAETLNAVNRTHYMVSRLMRQVGTASAVYEGNTARDVVVALLNDYKQALSNLASQTSGPWAPKARAFAANPSYGKIVEKSQGWLDTTKVDLPALIGLNPPVKARGEAPDGTTQAVAQAANKALSSRIDSLRQDARDDERRYLILSGLVLVGAALIAALIARSVTRPMRQLTRQAEAMAADHLPAAVQSVLETPPGEDVVVPQVPPVKVKTRDELQTVASALNHVQTSALGLAVEQATLRRNIADSFVSLGRRTQNLIGLQLELITHLEDDEADPVVLDSLYRLDHLATRARRNAESLVILGGIGAQRPGGAPVPMTDVVRAMLSEVEAYQRVDIVSADHAMVPNGAAADLIHLLAELVENGLSFSPPNKRVEVSGALSPAGYTITIVDHGVGMPAAKLEQANRRLSDNERFTVAPSRYLGHYVAGKLAGRVGATVSLAAGAEDGVVATVVVPSSVLVSDAQAEPRPIDSAASSTSSTGPAGPAGARAASRPNDAGTLGNHGNSDRVNGDAVGGEDADPADDPVSDRRRIKVDGRPPVLAGHGADDRNMSDGSIEPGDVVTTDGGLRKRVPGQAMVGQDRSPRLRSAGATSGEGGPLGAVTTEKDAENLASLLTAYTSGVERGREAGSTEINAQQPSPDSEPHQ